MWQPAEGEANCLSALPWPKIRPLIPAVDRQPVLRQIILALPLSSDAAERLTALWGERVTPAVALQPIAFSKDSPSLIDKMAEDFAYRRVSRERFDEARLAYGVYPSIPTVRRLAELCLRRRDEKTALTLLSRVSPAEMLSAWVRRRRWWTRSVEAFMEVAGQLGRL